jgi:hypothetical protein
MGRNFLVSTAVGMVAGAALTLAVGLPTGWLVTGGTADELARTAAVDSLVPLCVAKAQKSPDAEALLAQLKAMNPWTRKDFVASKGWSAIAGAEVPDGDIADACAVQLVQLAE